jgi:hypothetical protein
MCNVYKGQEAGEYTFEENNDYGEAFISDRLYQTSTFTGKNFTQRVIAKVSDQSDSDFAHTGGYLGAIVQIKGTGFSSDTSNYDCQVSGQICQVTAASANQISVEVPIYDVANTNFGKIPK